jgi:hypothetical protein
MKKIVSLGVGIIAAALLLGPGDAAADCVRWKKDLNAPPGLDGPGSFGPLQDTVTLDCLSYVRSIPKRGKEYVVIADERGATYELSVGDYMGEHTGLIRKIDGHFIHLEQMVPKGSDWVKTMVKFPKAPKNRK